MTATAINPALFDLLLARMRRTETGYKEHETGYEMTDEQLAAMNAALRLTKTKEYRPYCLNAEAGCSMPRVALRDWGFECMECGNRFGFDLTAILNT